MLTEKERDLFAEVLAAIEGISGGRRFGEGVNESACAVRDLMRRLERERRTA